MPGWRYLHGCLCTLPMNLFIVSPHTIPLATLIITCAVTPSTVHETRGPNHVITTVLSCGWRHHHHSFLPDGHVSTPLQYCAATFAHLKSAWLPRQHAPRLSAATSAHLVHPAERVVCLLCLQLCQGAVHLQRYRPHLPMCDVLLALSLIGEAAHRAHHHSRACGEHLISLTEGGSSIMINSSHASMKTKTGWEPDRLATQMFLETIEA